MCGITGIFSKNLVDPYYLQRMQESLYHRGPNSGNIWISKNGQIGLAHRRLAILDLTDAANQPMFDKTKSFGIVFNGEIYNFIEIKKELISLGSEFKTGSDTEVLLEAYKQWGVNCLNQINGAFAFCIYDSINNFLFFARDIAGEKPLYYSIDEQGLIFGSELKALMANPAFKRELNLSSLDFFLTYGYVPAEKCILKNANKLPPAHAMLLNTENFNFKLWQYWKTPLPDYDFPKDAEQLTNELHLLLKNSVKQQMVADVPIGILLSGGVDSSVITALASNVCSKRINTFTVTFPENPEVNEASHAKIVAKHFQTNHTELEAKPATVEFINELAKQFDEPIADSSMIPTYLLTKMVKKHCTVALGGDGADELFGGYPTYSWIKRQESFRKLCPNFVRNLIAQSANWLLPVGFKGRTNLIGLADGIENSLAHFNMLFDYSSRANLLTEFYQQQKIPEGIPEDFKKSLWQKNYGIAGASMKVDFTTYLADDILVKTDRTSMLNSLEVRAPFLDKKIIEFSFQKLPDSLKASSQQKKILLRKLAKQILPTELNLDRKQGFVLPLRSWLKGNWGIFMHDILMSTDCIFNKKLTKNLLSGQKMGMKNTERLFALVIFELWRKHYNITI